MTVTQSAYERKENDLYETPYWVTMALLNVINLAGRVVWEPAAGNHKMANVLKASACGVWTSDIETYSLDHDFTHDFLKDDPLSIPFDDIITNPPYGKQNRDFVKFAEIALRKSRGMVALLGTAKVDSGSTRRHLFRDNTRFLGKIVLLDRIAWFGDGGGTEDHAWYLWGPEPAVRYLPTIRYASQVEVV